MAYHSGTLINGDPVVCGGWDSSLSYDVKCFHYQRNEKTWKRVSKRIYVLYLPFFHLKLKKSLIKLDFNFR